MNPMSLFNTKCNATCGNLSSFNHFTLSNHLCFPRIVLKFKFLTCRYIPCILKVQKTDVSLLYGTMSLHNVMSSRMHVCFFRPCLCTSCSSSTEWACLLSSLASLLLLLLITHLSESFMLSKPFSLYKRFLSNV